MDFWPIVLAFFFSFAAIVLAKYFDRPLARMICFFFLFCFLRLSCKKMRVNGKVNWENWEIKRCFGIIFFWCLDNKLMEIFYYNIIQNYIIMSALYKLFIIIFLNYFD